MSQKNNPILNALFLTEKETKAFGITDFNTQVLVHQLLHRDDATTLKKMVSRGFSLNNFYVGRSNAYKCPNYSLILSVDYGALKVLDFLLTQNLDVNHEDSLEKGTPLFFAAKQKNNEAIETLLAAGADIGYMNANQESVLSELLKNKYAPGKNLNIIQKAIATKELTPLMLHAPNPIFGTVIQGFLSQFREDIFDGVLENIQTPTTLITLRKAVAIYNKILSFPADDPENQVGLPSNRLEARIFELEKAQLTEKLRLHEKKLGTSFQGQKKKPLLKI